MLAVRKGRYFCPKATECHPITVVKPPKLELVVAAIEAAAALQRKRMGFNDKRMPDRKWALEILYYFDPGNEIFAKDFEPERPVKTATMVDNSDGFFTGLPLGKFKKKRGMIFKEP